MCLELSAPSANVNHSDSSSNPDVNTDHQSASRARAHLGRGDGEARGVVRTGVGLPAQGDQLLDVADGAQHLVAEGLQRRGARERAHGLGRTPLALGPFLLRRLLCRRKINPIRNRCIV